MNVILDLYSNLKLTHDYVFKKELFFRCASKITNTLTSESIDLVYSIEIIESNEQNDDVRSLVSSAFSANFKFLKTNRHSSNSSLDVNTPASSGISDSFIDSNFAIT